MSALQGTWYSLRDIAHARERRINEFSGLAVTGGTMDLSVFGDLRPVLHPYVGYTLNPPAADELPENSIAHFGFHSRGGDFVTEADPNVVVVGVLGGSVAENFVINGAGAPALADALKRDVRFKDKEFRFSALALGGYKAPQQLLALNYALSLGAHFDLVIELSGFNEVTLPFKENLPAGLHPLYPRSWQLLAGHLSPEQLVDVGRIAIVRQQRATLARWSSGLWCRRSHTCGLLWYAGDYVLNWRILGLNEHLLAKSAMMPPDSVIAGPPVGKGGTGAVLTASVETWKRSIALIQDLGKAHGFHAYTFLQPSPFYGRKPISAAERRMLDPENWPGRFSRIGYPLLEEAVSMLRREGYRIISLVDVFADHPESLYTDGCCHVGQDGDRILAEAMAREILKHW